MKEIVTTMTTRDRDSDSDTKQTDKERVSERNRVKQCYYLIDF